MAALAAGAVPVVSERDADGRPVAATTTYPTCPFHEKECPKHCTLRPHCTDLADVIENPPEET